MDLNRILLIGNLTRDPETKAFSSGTQVTNFTIAVNDRTRGKDKETTMFVKVKAWGKSGDIAAQYLKKGSSVLVDGRLEIEEYDTKDGQKRRDPIVVADRISLGPKREGGSDGGSEGGGDYAPRERAAGGGSSYGGSRESSSPRQSSGDEGGSHGGGAEDDLPF